MGGEQGEAIIIPIEFHFSSTPTIVGVAYVSTGSDTVSRAQNMLRTRRKMPSMLCGVDLNPGKRMGVEWTPINRTFLEIMVQRISINSTSAY